MKKIFIALFTLLKVSTHAQTDSTKHPLSISGYLETYYGYDFSNPENHSRPGFVYSHNRHNEINLNLGFVKMGYATEKVRANFALMAGSYANANLAAEPAVFKNIYEANAGVKISPKKNVWIDAGIFASHIGFESAIGRDCWTLTRSMLAENSPYFESGIKLSYTSDNGEWFVSGLFLNGWQRIQRIEGNNTPAVGHQLTWKPTANITLNSSSFVGSDTPDSVRQMRYFHNFYAQLQLLEKLGVIVGLDYGAQQISKESSDYNSWYSPVIIAKYSPSGKINLAIRAEYYNDEKGVIINTGTSHGFQTYGYSINLDYAIAANIMWRIEGKGFTSRDKIFILEDKPDNSNYTLISSLAISF